MNDTSPPTVLKPQRCLARFEDKISFNEKFVEYHFECIEPFRLPFLAGQYVSIKVSPEGLRRSYSMCSSPAIDHGFHLLLDLSPAGVGSKYMESLKFGDQIEMIAPMGVFVVDHQKVPVDAPMVFIATGAGITPLYSMILDELQNRQSTRPMVLYWGMRYVQELFWLDELRQLAVTFPNFQFHPVISKAIEQWPLCRGRVTDCLLVHEIPVNGSYFLCGSQQMIADVGALLVQRGVTKEQIFYEKFF